MTSCCDICGHTIPYVLCADCARTFNHPPVFLDNDGEQPDTAEDLEEQ